MVSCLRYYDEAIINYISSINIDVGSGREFSPQVIMAIPSRHGQKIELEKSTDTPKLPFITLIRSGIAQVTETNIIRGRVTRPSIYTLHNEKKFYFGADSMPYDLNYNINFFSLESETHNQLTEVLLYKLKKKYSIPVFIDIQNVNVRVRTFIHDVAFSDQTSYEQVADNNTRIFHGTLSFALYCYLINTEVQTHVVQNIENKILDSVNRIELASYNVNG